MKSFMLKFKEDKESLISGYPHPQGLYNSINEHDSCGVGFIVDIKNRSAPII